MTEEIDRPYGNERPTTVTAKNLRSRRPEFLALAQGSRATRAESGMGGAEGLPHAKASRGEAVMGGRVVHIFIKRSPVGAGDGEEDTRAESN